MALEKQKPQRPAARQDTKEEPRQSIEELKSRYVALNESKIRAEEKKKEKEKRFEELRARAREAYGTDDLAQLKTRLEEMKAENEVRRARYQKHLEDIEARLAEIEAEHDALESGDIET